MSTELRIDPEIWESDERSQAVIPTGIYVRARRPDDGWESVDICYLDKASLLAWLRSRGGDNQLAEDVVGILLGHGHLHQ